MVHIATLSLCASHIPALAIQAVWGHVYLSHWNVRSVRVGLELSSSLVFN